MVGKAGQQTVPQGQAGPAGPEVRAAERLHAYRHLRMRG